MKKEIKNKAGIGGVMAGVGLVAVASVASAYFLYGSKEAAKNRKKAKGWMLKAKGEVIEGIEKLKSIDETTYNNLVEKVSEKYKKIKSIDISDVEGLTKELKGHWKNLKKEITPINKKTVKKVTQKKA